MFLVGTYMYLASRSSDVQLYLAGSAMIGAVQFLHHRNYPGTLHVGTWSQKLSNRRQQGKEDIAVDVITKRRRRLLLYSRHERLSIPPCLRHPTLNKSVLARVQIQ